MLTEKVNFDIIRYANCWEDADLLLEAFAAPRGGRFLSIGSAGDNSFSLLTTEPELVLAIDVSEVQLYLIELKKAAIHRLNHDDFLRFLGFLNANGRWAIYQQIKNDLSTAAQTYWNGHQHTIEAGVIHQGKFENYFKLFREKALRWIHTPKRIAELTAPKSATEQAFFYQKKWNNWRWKALFRIFFSKFIMGRFGRDPEFLKEVEVPVAGFIYNKTAAHLSSTLAQDNYFLNCILTGNFGEYLPHYARAENYQLIQSNIEKLKIFKGYAQDAFQAGYQFDYFNLSNIFEYMDKKLATQVAQNIAEHTNPSAKLMYWNLMVPRRLSQLLPKHFEHQTAISQKLTNKDKGFFYNCCILDELKKF